MGCGSVGPHVEGCGGYFSQVVDGIEDVRRHAKVKLCMAKDDMEKELGRSGVKTVDCKGSGGVVAVVVGSWSKGKLGLQDACKNKQRFICIRR